MKSNRERNDWNIRSFCAPETTRSWNCEVEIRDMENRTKEKRRKSPQPLEKAAIRKQNHGLVKPNRTGV